ncbi:MAG TPA: hypothetical protein VNU66_14375 [Mycobacteriales bacterium]|nr:hypothetical protein [Mycobacteriales bacterium]
MGEDATAWLLLAVDLLVVAVVLTLPLLALWWLVGRPRPRRGTPSLAPGERVLRRCESCGVAWKGRPGEDASGPALRLRRAVRRRTRAREAPTRDWARRRGWSRCPSCLSTDVRTSRADRSGV